MQQLSVEDATIPTLMSWSTGKDSAWTTYQLLQDPNINLVGLVCTVNDNFQRTASHRVRLELLQTQAARLNLPVYIVKIPYPSSNLEYQKSMNEFFEKAQHMGVKQIAYGDLFLEDIRHYREQQISKSGLQAIFPIWQTDTTQLAQAIISNGFRAMITCVNPKFLDASFAGREYDQAFLDDLPEEVDPCGENGEFHSFIFAAPIFSSAIRIQLGTVEERDGFVFADILGLEKA